MMKLLLVVLSVLCAVNSQTAETVSGCNSDIIESLGLKRTASLASLYPRLYYAAVPPFLGVGYDSAKIESGLLVNNKTFSIFLQCNASQVINKTIVEFTQATETRIEGVGFPGANSTLDYYPIECTDGLILTYVCDSTKVKGSGTEAFVVTTRTAEPVSTTAFEACKARAQAVYADVEFTTLTVGAC